MKNLFKKYQQELLAYVNTDFGREHISKYGGNEIKENYPIVKLTPESAHQLMGIKNNKPEIRAIFYSGPAFGNLLYPVLTQLDIAREFRLKDAKLMPLVIPHFLGKTRLLRHVLPIVLMDSATFNPDAGTNAIDGDVFRELVGTSEVWASIRSGNGNGTNPSAAAPFVFKMRANGSPSGDWIRLRRGIYGFLTSSLGAGATITAATLSMKGQAQENDDAGNVSPTINVYGATLSANNSLANSDYQGVGSTAFCNSAIAYGSFSTAGYNDFAFNASGLAAISPSGSSNFCSREATYDVGGTTPHWLGTAEANTTFAGFASGSNVPKLVVTYTPAPKSGGLLYII